MSDTERSVVIETESPDGCSEKSTEGRYTLFVDPEKNRLGVRDKDGHIVCVPLTDVAELIRGKVL